MFCLLHKLVASLDFRFSKIPKHLFFGLLRIHYQRFAEIVAHSEYEDRNFQFTMDTYAGEKLLDKPFYFQVCHSSGYISLKDFVLMPANATKSVNHTDSQTLFASRG